MCQLVHRSKGTCSVHRWQRNKAGSNSKPLETTLASSQDGVTGTSLISHLKQMQHWVKGYRWEKMKDNGRLLQSTTSIRSSTQKSREQWLQGLQCRVLMRRQPHPETKCLQRVKASCNLQQGVHPAHHTQGSCIHIQPTTDRFIRIMAYRLKTCRLFPLVITSWTTQCSGTPTIYTVLKLGDIWHHPEMIECRVAHGFYRDAMPRHRRTWHCVRRDVI